MGCSCYGGVDVVKAVSPLFNKISKGFKNLDIRQRKRGFPELGLKRIPFNPRSVAQTKIRKRYGELVESWNALTQAERDSWDEKAEPLFISGWNLYLQQQWVVVVGLDLIKEVTTDVDTDFLEALDLDLNTHKIYLVRLTVKNPLAVETWIYAYFEGDEVDTNYYMQYIVGNGTTVSANRVNAPDCAYVGGGQQATLTGLITRDPDGYVRLLFSYARGTGSDLVLVHRVVVKTGALTNLTKLKFKSTQAGGIGANSVLQLYGYKA